MGVRGEGPARSACVIGEARVRRQRLRGEIRVRRPHELLDGSRRQEPCHRMDVVRSEIQIRHQHGLIRRWEPARQEPGHRQCVWCEKKAEGRPATVATVLVGIGRASPTEAGGVATHELNRCRCRRPRRLRSTSPPMAWVVWDL